MVDKNMELHEVFIVDPLELKSFVGRYVKMNLVNGANVSGIVYTIDPVSQSVVLIYNENKFITMKIILKNSVKSINIVPDIPNELKNIEMSEFFTSYKGRKAVSDVNKRKEKVKSWLLKNMINVIEEGDKLLIDTLEIHPPYNIEYCFSSNLIVLDRIQKLLRELKDDDP